MSITAPAFTPDHEAFLEAQMAEVMPPTEMAALGEIAVVARPTPPELVATNQKGEDIYMMRAEKSKVYLTTRGKNQSMQSVQHLTAKDVYHGPQARPIKRPVVEESVVISSDTTAA